MIKCETCKYLFVDQEITECHRYPPVVIYDGHQLIHSIFPSVYRNATRYYDECGEYKEKNQKSFCVKMNNIGIFRVEEIPDSENYLFNCALHTGDGYMIIVKATDSDMAETVAKDYIIERMKKDNNIQEDMKEEKLTNISDKKVFRVIKYLETDSFKVEDCPEFDFTKSDYFLNKITSICDLFATTHVRELNKYEALEIGEKLFNSKLTTYLVSRFPSSLADGGYEYQIEELLESPPKNSYGYSDVLNKVYPCGSCNGLGYHVKVIGEDKEDAKITANNLIEYYLIKRKENNKD